jgi:hypothetical protein
VGLITFFFINVRVHRLQVLGFVKYLLFVRRLGRLAVSLVGRLALFGPDL